jgi:hypothetical protein
MTIRNFIVRTEIKLLLKYYEHQVKDILESQGKHIQRHKLSRKEFPAQYPTTATVNTDGKAVW